MFRKPPASDLVYQKKKRRPMPSDYSRAATLITRLGRVLLTMGSPAHRVEAALTLVAKRLGLSSQILSTPTALVVSLGDGLAQQTFMVRANPGPPNLGKLVQTWEVIVQLSDGQISTSQACDQVDRIYRAPARFGPLLSLLAFVLTSTAVVIFLGGGLKEMVLASTLGLITGLISITSVRWESLSRLSVPLTATLTSFLATVYCIWQQETMLIIPIIAGLIVLIPGLDITTATRELATGHLLAGSARLGGAIVVLLAMTFGLALGSTLGQTVAGEIPVIEPHALPEWTLFVALPIMTIGLSILFRALLQDWIWILIACTIAMLSIQFAQEHMGPVLGACMAGAIVGLSGNIFVYFTGKPASIINIPGMLLLVPGSIGFRSLATLLQRDVVSGVESFFNTMMIAMALATGMIIASVLLPPKNEL